MVHLLNNLSMIVGCCFSSPLRCNAKLVCHARAHNAVVDLDTKLKNCNSRGTALGTVSHLFHVHTTYLVTTRHCVVQNLIDDRSWIHGSNQFHSLAEPVEKCMYIHYMLDPNSNLASSIHGSVFVLVHVEPSYQGSVVAFKFQSHGS